MYKALLVTVFTLAATKALAFTPIPYAEVKSLQSKQVFLADSVELDRKSRGWAYAGQAVTLERCDKTTSTITSGGAKVTGWRYARCKVKTADGLAGTVPFKVLSKTKLAFDLRDPGTPSALRRAAFDEAFETALAMVKFAKAHEAELRSSVVTSTLDNQPVLGEHYEAWHAMVAAQAVAQKLHRELVVGSRLTTESILRDRKYGWLTDAQNEELMTTWSKGVADPAQKKKLEAGIHALGKLNGVAAFGTLSTRIGEERAAKAWRRGISGSEAQQAALDKENEARLDKRLADGKKSFEKQLAEAQSAKKGLRW
jgi:hypothetical protein